MKKTKIGNITLRPEITQIQDAVAADESLIPYDDTYYLYREKLNTAPEWYRLTYGDKGLKYFKFWLSTICEKETLSRHKRFRLGRAMARNLTLYDDREWAVIQSEWETRGEWKGV